jgi:hypothetical protein
MYTSIMQVAFEKRGSRGWHVSVPPSAPVKNLEPDREVAASCLLVAQPPITVPFQTNTAPLVLFCLWPLSSGNPGSIPDRGRIRGKKREKISNPDQNDQMGGGILVPPKPHF